MKMHLLDRDHRHLSMDGGCCEDRPALAASAARRALRSSIVTAGGWGAALRKGRTPAIKATFNR